MDLKESGQHRWLLLTIFASYLLIFDSNAVIVKLTVLAIGWLLTGGFYWCYLFYNTWRRDFRFISRSIPVLWRLLQSSLGNKNFVYWFREQVKRNPNKVMVINCSSGQEWTYQQVEAMSNKVAHAFLELKYKKGDVVALFMENKPEFVVITLGLAKIGVVTAFINTNLRLTSLVNTIKVSSPRALIYGTELRSGAQEVLQELLDDGKFEVFYFKEAAEEQDVVEEKSFNDLRSLVQVQPSHREPESITNSISCNDIVLFIYTSGTTGLPKAVPIKHLRFLLIAFGTPSVLNMKKDDVMYCYLPMYHTSGQMIMCPAFVNGEICRYLLNSPVCPEEKQHKVRLLYGNGLQPSLWEKFATRFRIKEICEIYGATEGNGSLLNLDGKVGAVGFKSVILPEFLNERILPIRFLKLDPDTGDVLRDPKTGLCLQCDQGEPGELVGKIVKGDPLKEFCGYKDQNESKKKILRDVVVHGDSYFRTGDLLYKDEFGWIYFKDRIGDTFRWKGENVSTAEVESILSKVPRIVSVTIYGVLVPGTNGRAGMAALIMEKTEDMDDLSEFQQWCNKLLPAYARPLFVRILKEVEMTGTYKMKKTRLRDDGFNLEVIKDNLYFMDGRANRFVPLTKDIFEEIINGKLKL